MGHAKRDDFGSMLQSTTMRDWVERVCQQQNSFDHQDCVIADQKKTIASQLAIIERQRCHGRDLRPGGDESRKLRKPAVDDLKSSALRPQAH